MAYVTVIGANPEQVEYRLAGAHGCNPAEAAHTQFSYHADGRERPLVWTGAGLPEVGITPGTVLSEEQFEVARALMAGLDPRTGERLVEPKLAVCEDAKVPLAPLVRAVQTVAASRGIEPVEVFASVKLAKAYQRAVRSVEAGGEGARLRADEAGRLADAAGLDVEALWGSGAYAVAFGNLTETQTVTGPDGVTVEKVVPRRRVVGNLGYDVSFTLPKSHSLLLAFADDDTAASVERVYTEQVGATFDWLEEQTAYGMRGKHGDGNTAATVQGSGFLGWSMVHRAARPVGDRVVGDPHWHVHVSIANMTRGTDGQWSTVAAGGRDLMRHAPAADHVLKALIRRRLADRFGVEFARSERTGAWEVAAIPDATLRTFSKRGASIEAMLRDLGFDPKLATRRAEDLAAAQTRHDKSHATAEPDATLRSIWQDEAREHGVDPDQLAAAALPRRPQEPAPATPRGTGAAGAGTVAGIAQDADSPQSGPAAGTDSAPDGGPYEREPTPGPGEDLGDDVGGREREAALLRDVVARLLDPEQGLTSAMRRFTRVDAVAAVADALPAGAGDVQEIELLTDRALQDTGIVPLPSPVPAQRQAPAGGRRQLGAGHMRNAERFTTADVVAAEDVILTAATASAEGQGAARVSPRTAALARAAVQAGLGFELSAEQGRAVERLVTSDRQLDAVLGPPGTGKTTLMRAARAAWEAEGYVVAGAATAAVAAQNLTAESGITSRTVAQWVHRISRGDGLAGVDVLVLDEANLTDDRDRAKLYTAAAESGTKLVEVGDPKQLRGVGCGSLFGRVHELVGGGELTANRRQREEDERAAIAAWRDGKYSHALGSWSERGRLVATETGGQALTAMVARWMSERAGAPDPHAEMRGVVMLAASNETVDRLNSAAQAVRGAAGELGAQRTYDVRGGRSVTLREGDHVLIRLNDRAQRMHEGPDVLNGYRGVVEGIEDGGAVRVAWQQQSQDGHVEHRARLRPAYVAAGGLTLGYAMTGHKAEGLTVSADWAQPAGTHQGGTVLVYGPGMDEPGLHVATSRHRDRMFLFAGRDQLEGAGETYEQGVPRSDAHRDARVIAALAEQAKVRSTNANDRPVHDDLQRGPVRPAAARDDPAGRWRALQAQDPATGGRSTERTTSPAAAAATPGQDRPMSRYSFTSGEDRWHLGWDPAVASYYAQVEPVRTPPGADDAQVLRTVAGARVGEVPTLAALDARLGGRVQVPAGLREQLADEQLAEPGPARPAVAAQRATSRPGAAERLVGLEERELNQRAAAWAALSGRATTSSNPAGAGRDKPAAKPAADRTAEQEARRQEAARREDDARRQDRGRGPRL